jgi:hypothetical protein
MNPPIRHRNIPNVIELISEKGFEGMTEIMQLLVFYNKLLCFKKMTHYEIDSQRTSCHLLLFTAC